MSSEWTVLLIGGPSSVGKSTAAKEIARRFGIPWLQVDDLRLALLASRATLPEPDANRKLYFFDETPDVWSLPLERLRDGFIGVGEALSPAIAQVITNHLANAEPIVIEGDGILPSLPTRPDVRQYAPMREVQAVFVIPADERLILTNMIDRGWGVRGPNGEIDAALHANVEAKWLYSQWLAAQAHRLAFAVVDPEPRQTLPDRIIVAIGSTPEPPAMPPSRSGTPDPNAA